MVGLGNLRCQYQEVSILALIVGINRFSAENLKVESQDGLTDTLIWGGLGNLRFLQDNSILIVTEDVFWRAAKIPGSILRPQTPLSYPSQKKTAQKDVTAETEIKSALKKTQ